MPLQKNLIIDSEIKDSFKVLKLSKVRFDASSLVSVVYNRIFVLTKADGSINIDHKSYVLKGQEIYLVAKGQVFSFTDETRLNGFEILFGDCFWERTPASASNCKAVLFNNTALNQRLPLVAELIPICDMLLQEYSGDDYPNKLDAMAAYLKIMMIKLANLHTSSNAEMNSFDNQLYQKFIELVNARFHTQREVSDYAKELAVSPRKLTNICQQKNGYGAKEIITGFLIAEAKRSLQFSTKPIKQIAYDLSFASPEQFSHFFKKSTKASPGDYRNIFVNIGR